MMPVRTTMPVRAVVHEQTSSPFGWKGPPQTQAAQTRKAPNPLDPGQGGLAQRSLGELGDAGSERCLRPEAEVPCGALG